MLEFKPIPRESRRLQVQGRGSLVDTVAAVESPGCIKDGFFIYSMTATPKPKPGYRESAAEAENGFNNGPATTWQSTLLAGLLSFL
jgi:hypothetical protein